jgi:hypothetical protein
LSCDEIRGCCERAGEQAFLRGRRGGSNTIDVHDLFAAVDEMFGSYAGRLTPFNLGQYVDWEPETLAHVVAVEAATAHPTSTGYRHGVASA